MAKNPRRQQEATAASNPPTTALSAGVTSRGKKVIGFGVGAVVLGYIVLTYTDPAGQNWASTLSPALLVLGYALIGVGIILPDPSPTEKINS